MKKRWRPWMLLLLLTAAIILGGCSQKKEEGSETESQTETETETETEAQGIPEGMMKSYLTGELVSEEIGLRRPIAVMFNNVEKAIPHTGISRAGVVYEAPAEGGVVRLMGIMEDYDDLQKIGSVRSARTYFVYLQQEWESIFVHYGQCDYALPYLEQTFVQNLNGVTGIGNTVFFRSTDRKAPHNAYASAEGIKAGIAKKGYETAYSDSFEAPLSYLAQDAESNPSVANGQPAKKITVGYVNNDPWFVYNASDKLYYRYQFDGAQIDDLTGEQLAYRNVIIQVCDYSHYYEVTDYLFFELWGTGKGYYFTDGKYIPITWKKDTEWGPTRYYDESGKEIELNPGKTWISIVQTERMDKIIIDE